MERARQNAKRILLSALALGAGVFTPQYAAAQRQPQQTQRLLVLPPLPVNPSDSGYVVAFADQLRGDLEGKTRRQWTVVAKDKIGEALEASGFSPDALLDDNAAQQLARFLQADAYVIGKLERTPAPKVDLHLLDLRRSGLLGWVHYTGQPNEDPKKLGGEVANAMEPHIKAAEYTRDCLDRRDRRDFSTAKDRARRAFAEVPNQPAAAMCLAIVEEVEQAPVDSQVAALEMAVKGDSTYTRALEMLGRKYQQAGTHADSLKAADIYLQQLAADPSDQKLRTGVAALLITMKEFARARDVIDEGLKTNPDDLAALQLQARACEDGATFYEQRADSLSKQGDSTTTSAARQRATDLWACLAHDLAAQFDLDSTLAGKADFYGKIFGAAQRSGDTTAMLKWSGEAVRHLPNEVAFWRARAAALKTAGQTDSAVVAYRRIMELDPKDIASPLQIVQVLSDQLVIDSTVPLDTARLMRIDSLLQRVITARSTPGGAPADTAVWMNAAVLYFKPATEMVQKRVRPDVAAQWLEKAEKYDVRKQLTTQANFFLGLALMFNLQSEFDFNVLQKSKDCRKLASLGQYVQRTRGAMTTGASVQQATADQVLKQLDSIDKFVVDAGKAWQCK